MTEQIWANELRFYRETSPRSGTPAGDVWTIPMGPAASARRVEAWGGKSDAFRQPLPMLPLMDYHEGRMTLSVGLAFLGWLLTQHAADQGGGVWNFDRTSEAPTFCLEVETPSDLFAFRGIAFQDIQITARPPELVSLDLSFMALERVVITALTAATGDLWSEVIPSKDCVLAYAAGPWGADPRTDDFYSGAYGVAWHLTRRNLQPAQFMPDGKPIRFTSVPWRIMADITTAANDLTRQAKFRATGRLALFLGPAGESLDLVADVTSLYSEPDPVKAVDFREESLMAEMHPDYSGSLMSVRDNSGLIP